MKIINSSFLKNLVAIFLFFTILTFYSLQSLTLISPKTPLQPILTLGAIQANAQGSGVAGSQTGPGFTDCFPSSSGGNSIFNCLRAVFTFLLIVAIFLAALRIALLALGAINPLEVGNGLSNVKEEVTKLVTGVVLLSSFTIIINTVNPAALQIDFLSSLGQIVTRGSSGNLNTPPEINIGTNIGQVVANNNTTPAVNPGNNNTNNNNGNSNNNNGNNSTAVGPQCQQRPVWTSQNGQIKHYCYLDNIPSQADLVTVNGHLFEKNAATSAQALFTAMRSAGLRTTLDNAFRPVSQQVELFGEDHTRPNAAADARARSSAPPGYSEHQTGQAFDFAPVSGAFANTNEYRWLTANASRYNWRLSFPENNPQGVIFEPWHWSYTGTGSVIKR